MHHNTISPVFLVQTDIKFCLVLCRFLTVHANVNAALTPAAQAATITRHVCTRWTRSQLSQTGPHLLPATFWIFYGVPRCRRDAGQALNQILTIGQAEREDKEGVRDRLTGGDGGMTVAL